MFIDSSGDNKWTNNDNKNNEIKIGYNQPSEQNTWEATWDEEENTSYGKNVDVSRSKTNNADNKNSGLNKLLNNLKHQHYFLIDRSKVLFLNVQITTLISSEILT